MCTYLGFGVSAQGIWVGDLVHHGYIETRWGFGSGEVAGYEWVGEWAASITGNYGIRIEEISPKSWKKLSELQVRSDFEEVIYGGGGEGINVCRTLLWLHVIQEKKVERINQMFMRGLNPHKDMSKEIAEDYYKRDARAMVRIEESFRDEGFMRAIVVPRKKKLFSLIGV